MKKRLLSMFCAVMIMIGCGGMVMVHNDGVVMAASAAAPYKTGDVSGDGVINTVDARMALQYIVQKIDLTGAALTAADVSGDGSVDTVDVRMILQYIVGKLSSFPVGDTFWWPPLPEPDPEFPFQDPRLSFAERAADLISRMTLPEKQAQLGMNAPAIARLGVPAYNYWNEALHGITEKGPSTSFPVPFSMASSWNPELINQVASAISDEARGYAAKVTGTSQVTLSYWSPTINLARDPRWGRNEESYGEDPFLTAAMAGQFVNGMQGNGDGVSNPYDGEKYLKTISTLKHFAANNSEFNRRTGDSVMDNMTLRNYYTWAFMDIVEQFHVASVMTAFNRVNGTPAVANSYLLDTLLRKTWGFDGHVVSDCGVVDDLVDRQVWIPDGWSRPVNRTEAAAFALKAGTDLNCGYTYTSETLNALNAGLITEDDMDQALLRIFNNRMRTGEFDSPEFVAYRQITSAALEAQKNRDLALEAARESLILLKNEPKQGGTDTILPVDINKVNSIAVYGPLSKLCDLGAQNYIGSPTETVSFRQGLSDYLAKNNYKGTVNYYDGISTSNSAPFVCNIQDVDFGGDFRMAVDNNGMSDTMAFDPREDGVPKTNVGQIYPGTYLRFNNVDVSAIQYITLSTAGTYDQTTDARIEVRVGSTSGYLLAEVDCSPTGGWQTYQKFATDTIYAQQIFDGPQDIYLIFNQADQALLDQASINKAGQADLAIVYAGTSGSDTIPGYMVSTEDQDRNNLKLPSAQDALIQAVAEKNPNTVAVIQSAGIQDLSGIRDSVKAILYSSYNGQYQGTALAETLFGQSDPGGRLPVTWYKNEADIPNIADYTVKAENGLLGRTYMYFQGAVEYPFGYGLSYTDFTYSDISLSETSVTGDGVFDVTLKVTNTGSRTGADVVQVYIGAPDYGTNPDVPQKELKGFTRVGLAAGETKTVTVPMKVSDFSRIHENDGLRTVTPGIYKIMVGRSCEDIKATDEITVTAAAKPTIQTVTLRGEKVVAKPGDRFGSELTVAMSDESFLDLADAAVVYTSSDPAVASVDNGGVVTALTAGVTTITVAVTADGVTKNGSFPAAVKA